MKKTLLLLVFTAAAVLPAGATPASTDSVDKLLALAKVDRISDSVLAQMNRSVDQGVRQMLQGQEPTAAQQALIASLHQQLTAIVTDALSWPKLKAGYELAYTSTFSQEEIDGLIAFYSTPAGQAFADKQPEIGEETSALIQRQMGPIMSKIQGAMEDTAQKLQASQASAAEAAEPAAAADVAQDQHDKGPVPIHISHGQKIALKDYLVAGKTTVFDFYSDYCPPCRALSPLLEQLHKGRADVAVVKVDINRPGITGIDWQSPVAQEFGLDSIPHLKVYNPDGTLKSQGDEARTLVMGWIEALNK